MKKLLFISPLIFFLLLFSVLSYSSSIVETESGSKVETETSNTSSTETTLESLTEQEMLKMAEAIANTLTKEDLSQIRTTLSKDISKANMMQIKEIFFMALSNQEFDSLTSNLYYKSPISIVSDVISWLIVAGGITLLHTDAGIPFYYSIPIVLGILEGAERLTTFILDKILEKERNKLLTEKEILQIKKVVLNTLTNKDLSQIQEALDKFILDGDISPLKFALSEVFSEDEILDMRKALYSKPNKIIAFRPMSTNIRLANRLSPAERLQITSDNKTTFSEEEVLQITRAFSKTLSEADISKITNIFFKALSERELTLLKDKLHYTTDRPSSVLAFLTGIGVIIGILHNFELIPWYYSTATLAVGAGALAPKIKKAIQEWMIEQKKKVKNKCAMVFSPQK